MDSPRSFKSLASLPEADEADEADEAEEAPALPPSGIVSAAVGQVVAVVVASIAVAVFFYDRATRSIDTGVWPVVSQFPFLWVCLTSAVFVAAKKRNETVRVLTGLRAVPKDLWFLLGGVALQLVGAPIYTLLNRAEEVGKPAKDLIENARNNAFGFAVLAFLVGVGAPIMEEVFYRGLVYRSLSRVFGQRFDVSKTKLVTILSILLSALWFGAIHLQPLQFPLLFLVGVVCATLTMKFGRLGPAIFVHMGFNLLTVVSLGFQLRQKA